MMNNKGKITISRVTSNIEADYVEIRLVDQSSGVEFVTAKLSLDDFALAITGLSRVGCDLELNGLDRVGKLREQKTESLPLNGWELKKLSGAEIDMLLAPYEIDGWAANRAGMKNYKNFKGNDDIGHSISVDFVRFVDAEGG